jgi:hypothetical protein
MPTFPSSWSRLITQTKAAVDVPTGKFQRILLIVALTPFLAPSAARADPIRMQCWDCLQRLAMELPAVNPQEDPSYEQGLTPGSVLPALTTCSLDDSQLPDLRRIIQVFTDAQVKGEGVAYVRQQLEHMPEVSEEDRAKLLDGARQDLDTTLRHLIDHNCRLLLQAHFDEGGSRTWLLHMIDIGRGPGDR